MKLKIKFACVILAVFVGGKYALSESMFMDTPRSAGQVKAAQIPGIEKSKVTELWLSETFHISDRSISSILTQSIKAYNSPCPCPYNLQKNGHRCGGNSAYSKPGGAEPLCYPADVLRK